MNGDNAIVVKNLSKFYGEVEVLKNLSLEIPAQGQYVIRGASGSGKSTLLYLLGGLESCSSGSIAVGDKNLDLFNPEQLSSYRNQNVGFIFQFHFLLPSLNCLDNILLPGLIRGRKDLGEIKKKVQHLSKILNISDCLNKYPYQISGGQQQRVNILRALSTGPRLVLCDEPTGNLDTQNSKIVIDLIKNLVHEFKATLILVTHDDEVANFFDKTIYLKDGEIYKMHL